MMRVSMAELVQQVQQDNDFQKLADAIPYSRTIGMKVQGVGDELLFHLPRNPDNIGNPLLPAIHGGVIGGFMELAAALQLLIKNQPVTMPKVIDFSLDYLRAGKDRDTWAECQVWRQGNRVANVAIMAWQTRRDSPIATARAHFLLQSGD